MDIDPAHTPSMQVAVSNKRDYIPVRDHARLVNPLIVCQQTLAATPVADQKFPIDSAWPATSSRPRSLSNSALYGG